MHEDAAMFTTTFSRNLLIHSRFEFISTTNTELLTINPYKFNLLEEIQRLNYLLIELSHLQTPISSIFSEHNIREQKVHHIFFIVCKVSLRFQPLVLNCSLIIHPGWNLLICKTTSVSLLLEVHHHENLISHQH